jgi:signal transduction histidine kinase
MLKDPETGQLEPKVRRHRRDADNQQKMTISKTILDYVVEKNEGVLTSNARDDDRWNPAQSILQMGVREAICTPMQGRYGMVGVIYIDTSTSPQQIIQQQRAANKFSDQHLKLMIAIAHQAALAVEDTSYYKAMVQAERLAAIGQTIATLSHHIKNVLQGIRGGSYLIEMGLDEHKKGAEAEDVDVAELSKSVDIIRKGWTIVEKNQQRISTLVLDMLTFSKDREPQPAASNLNETVADVVELMNIHAVERGVELQWRPAKEMPTLMFDPEGLHRAVLNVVTNAIDGCDEREDGQVTISTSYGGDPANAKVVVQDNGSGISREDLEKIFTIFVSKKGGRGTGLGLPVSQKILNEHGGRIDVDSKVGKGSIFTLAFPAVAAEPEVRETLLRDK